MGWQGRAVHNSWSVSTFVSLNFVPALAAEPRRAETLLWRRLRHPPREPVTSEEPEASRLA